MDNHSVRVISLNPTQGLARGSVVETDGKNSLSRLGKIFWAECLMFLEIPIDHLEPLPKGERRNTHKSPPPLSKRSVKSEVFETGIRAIDVLVPLERDGKGGLFGRHTHAWPWANT